MHYSDSAADVRLDQFKPSGKWYQTVKLDMTGYYASDAFTTPVDAVLAALKDQFPRIAATLDEGWFAVVLDPYHQYSYPVMLGGK